MNNGDGWRPVDHSRDVELVLDVRLPWPPSANQYWRTTKTGRVYVSPEAKRYRKQVVLALWREDVYHEAGPGTLVREELQSRVGVSLTLHAPTKRKYDIDNRVKQVLDALEHAGVYADDEQVDELYVSRGHVDKENPRCELWLWEV